MASSLWPLQVFDRDDDFTIVDRKLPHWSQAGTLCFITWRTRDSIPQPVLRRWHSDRDEWLRRHDIDSTTSGWKERLHQLDRSKQVEFAKQFSERWHGQLDRCHGACVLRRSDCSRIVADSLLHFDGDRYHITDFIVMPNHVHLLAAFRDEDSMLAQCENWKRFQATRINQLLSASGRFWQQDGFDHLVRSVNQFETLRGYIATNPAKASLHASEFRHYSNPT